ncbi:MAG TPA: hypothetical protein VFN26_02655 [Candidatus Acidoferrum sp.]|nr:hypothetical protein [Candidatus Acidoferrum sp.]
MSAFAYFLMAAVAILGVCLLLSRRAGRRDFDREAYGTGQETFLLFGRDSVDSELSARIFDPEDLDFVAIETSRRNARQFRQERTALALDWLRAVRGQVNQSIRAHVRDARENAGLKPSDEIRLGFEFLLFQLSSGILYLVIWVCGPPRAAKLLGYSLKLAAQLRNVTEDVLPAGRYVGVELMDNKQEPRS